MLFIWERFIVSESKDSSSHFHAMFEFLGRIWSRCDHVQVTTWPLRLALLFIFRSTLFQKKLPRDAANLLPIPACEQRRRTWEKQRLEIERGVPRLCRGTDKSGSSLLPKVAAPFTTNASIRNLAHMTANQLAAAAKGIVTQFEARSGHSYHNASEQTGIFCRIDRIFFHRNFKAIF